MQEFEADLIIADTCGRGIFLLIDSVYQHIYLALACVNRQFIYYTSLLSYVECNEGFYHTIIVYSF